MSKTVLFDGRNPLKGKRVLAEDIRLDGFQRAEGEHKVQVIFLFFQKLLMVAADAIGAFDQPHVTENGEQANYPGKGEILTALKTLGKKIASTLMPTDYIPLEKYADRIPAELQHRCSVHEPAQKQIKVEFVVRSTCEGSMYAKVGKKSSFNSHRLPKGLKLGKMLPYPFFTPTTKAPKGQKDKPLKLVEYFSFMKKNYADGLRLAHYLYGMSVLLHLLNRKIALICGLDRPDQKVEFGIFPPGAELHKHSFRDEEKPLPYWWKGKWTNESAAKLFSELCREAGFSGNAWKKMPLFDLNLFCEYARMNAKSAIIRLDDEYFSTDDGRYRPKESTQMARDLTGQGMLELARACAEDYLCKEYFRLASKRTGKGGYDEDAGQVVVIPDAVLEETGNRNLKVLLRLVA